MPWPENNSEYIILESDDYTSTCGRLSLKENKILTRKLNYLKDNPRHPSLNTKPLHPSAKVKKRLEKEGVSKIYEFYFNQKKWRCVIYIFESEKIVYVVNIMNHEKVQKLLK